MNRLMCHKRELPSMSNKVMILNGPQYNYILTILLVRVMEVDVARFQSVP